MDDVLEMGTKFPERLVKEVFFKANGKSALAKLSNQVPVSFVGNKEMMFTMDGEVELVGESEPKSYHVAALTPVVMTPKKVQYGFRVSDEFLYATEAEQIEVLGNFTDGFAKKVARGLDIMSFHGFNPKTATAAASLANINFDALVTQTVTTTSGSEDTDIETAIAKFDNYDIYDVNGIAMSKAYRTSLSKLTIGDSATKIKMFPELKWGADVNSLNGLAADINNTVSFGDSADLAILGDFDYFKWGYAKEIPMEIIRYGDPDGRGDLKRYNQVFIRAEAFIGWAIMDANAFVRIVESDSAHAAKVAATKARLEAEAKASKAKKEGK